MFYYFQLTEVHFIWCSSNRWSL